MDVKRTQGYAPPVVLQQRPKLSVDPSEVRRTEASMPGSSSQAARPVGQRGSVSELVEAGRSEGMAQHQAMLDRLKAEIANGSYKPDWDVVAQRVQDALEAA